MKLIIPVTVDISFDLESDGVVQPESAINADTVKTSLADAIHAAIKIDTDTILDVVSGDVGWCIESMTVTV